LTQLQLVQLVPEWTIDFLLLQAKVLLLSLPIAVGYFQANFVLQLANDYQ
jgi:uncharacterized membrane protein YwzB